MLKLRRQASPPLSSATAQGVSAAYCPLASQKTMRVLAFFSFGLISFRHVYINEQI